MVCQVSIVGSTHNSAIESHDSSIKLITAALAVEGPGFQPVCQLAQDECLKQFDSFCPRDLLILVQKPSILSEGTMSNGKSAGNLSLGDVPVVASVCGDTKA